MRKLIESTFTTLDGDVSTKLMEWGPLYWDDEYLAYERELLFASDALVLGRKTYDGFSTTWPERSGDDYSDRINAMPKYVATNTMTELTWNASPLDGDGVAAVRALKEQPGGNLLKFGSGEFSRALVEDNGIDEFHLWRFPVIAGASDTRFDGLAMTELDLIDAIRFKSGIVVEVYQPKH